MCSVGFLFISIQNLALPLYFRQFHRHLFPFGIATTLSSPGCGKRLALPMMLCYQTLSTKRVYGDYTEAGNVVAKVSLWGKGAEMSEAFQKRGQKHGDTLEK